MLEQNTRELVRKSEKTFIDKLTPDTMAAAIKEHRGVKIYHPQTGKVLNHVDKWREASKSVTKALKGLKSRIDDLNRLGLENSAEGKVCQEHLSRLSKTKDLYTKLMEEAKCPNHPQVPRP